MNAERRGFVAVVMGARVRVGAVPTVWAVAPRARGVVASSPRPAVPHVQPADAGHGRCGRRGGGVHVGSGDKCVEESGVYFVESLHASQVNPLVGWSQGHFLIEPQAGGEAGVLTAHHEPVLAVDAADAAPVTAAMNTFSKGVAKGVVVQEALSAQAASRPLSVEEFKRSVRALVAESQ